MIRTLLQKVPGGPNAQVFVGTSVILGLCAIPVFAKPNEKAGHDLFSQQRPEAVVESQEKLLKEHRLKKKST